jgi:hypothetical protein
MAPVRNGRRHAVAGEVLKQGFTAEEIVRIGGGNFVRVFNKVTGA